MENFDINEIAMLVSIEKYAHDKIEEFKAYCRIAPQNEIDKINNKNAIHIKRENKPITTRGEEYDKKVKELKLKYPTRTTYEENGKITLTASNYTISKKDIITNKFLTLNKTQLLSASKQANIK